MGKNSTLVTRPDVTDEQAILHWLDALVGVPEDQLLEGLTLDRNGEPLPPPIARHEATWSYDPFTGRLLSLGVGAWSIFGIPVTELRREPALMFRAILPEDIHVLVDLARIADLGGEISRDYRLRRRDGAIRWIRARAVLVREATGGRPRVDGVLQDVTEERERREAAEHRLHRVVLQRKAIEDIFHDGDVNGGDLGDAMSRLGVHAARGMEIDAVSIWIRDEESGCMVRRTSDGTTPDRICPDRHATYFRSLESERVLVAPDAATDPRTMELVGDYPESDAVVSTLDSAVLKGGVIIGLIKFEHGSRRDWLPEERTFVGRIAEHAAQILEHLDRERAEHELALFQATVEQSCHGMVIAGFDGVIRFANPAFSRTLGYGEGELIGRNVTTFIAESSTGIDDHIRERLSLGDTQVLAEMDHVRRDGVIVPGLIHANPVEDPRTGELCVAVTLTDITDRKRWEMALTEERRRLRTLMSSLPGMAFRLRNAPDWPVEFLSDGCEQVIGWKAEDIMDDRLVTHAECVHPDDRPMVWAAMDKAMAAGEPYELEYRIIDAQGRTKWVWEHGVGVYEDGELMAVEGFVQDIDERVKARRALAESEGRYRQLIDNLNVGVAVYSVSPDGKRFSFADYNRAGVEMDGVRREDILGREVRECFQGVDKYGLTDVFERVWRTGEPERHPLALYNDDDIVSWRENYVYRLPNGEIVAVYEDLTEKVQAQQALRLKQISIDQANDAMIWTVPDGTLIDANERACELYGYDRDDLLRRTIFDLTTAYSRDTWQRRWEQLRKCRSLRSESWHQCSDGRVIPVEVSTRYLEFEEQEFHCTIIRDLTEQKRHENEIKRMNEELERRVDARTRELRDSQDQLLQNEKMAALGRLVAGVTHEINTPMGIGVTAASHLQDAVSSTRYSYESGTMKRSDFESFLSDADESARMILSNLGKASRLIQGFKGVAVDQSDEARRKFDMGEYLDEILMSLRPRLKKTRIQVDLDCPAGLTVDSHPGALSQIVTNLVMNSLIHAFGDDGEGRISIDVRAVDDDVQLVFADDGSGMDADTVRKIYEPFFTTKRGAGGSGLGMHVVYTSVTEALGGRISCESRPGEGTIFTLVFPRERSRHDD